MRVNVTLVDSRLTQGDTYGLVDEGVSRLGELGWERSN